MNPTVIALARHYGPSVALWAGAAMVVGGSLTFLYYQVKGEGKAECQAEYAAQVQAAKDAATTAANKRALKLEAQLAQSRAHNQELNESLNDELAKHTVYRECRVPADGVRIINRALAGSTGTR